MKKNVVLFFLLLAGTTSIYAQQKPISPKTFKYGKIEPAEFETKVSGADSAARGIKLFDVGRCWFEVSSKTGSFVHKFERHVRYKVMNKTGYDLADFEIPLYQSTTGGSEEKLEFMDAAAYNMENGKMVVSKITKDAKFSEKKDKNRSIKKFTLPNVKEGTIVEYRYKIVSDFIFELPTWYFQSSVPTLYSEFDIVIPEYLKYKPAVNGYVPIQQIKKEQINTSYYIPSTGTSTSAGNIQATALEVKYAAENVPAIKKEAFITTVEDYISKIEYELTATQYPGSMYKDFSSSWPKIVKELTEEDKFGKFLSRNGYSKSTLPALLKEEKDPELKTELIFNYVKNNLKWNDRYGIYTSSNNPKSVFEQKSGNTADINLSLCNMLNEGGIKAYPVLISTRQNGTHPGYPLLSKFNSVIVLAEVAGKTHLLDATDKHLASDLISTENLCHQGLKVDPENQVAEWVSLEESIPSKNNIYYSLTLGEDNKLTGMLFLSYTKYAALRQRSKYTAATNEADYLKDFKKDKSGLEISNYKIENLNSPNELLTETMNVTIEDNTEEAGNLTLLSPLLFDRTKENPFKLEERNYPVDFAYPIEENFRITIEFPKSYKLEKLPANGKVKLPNNEASFTYLFATEDNKVSITSKINILKSVFSAEEYHSLKELFKNIVEKQAQQIVFKKS
ncbi:DUF3858 domain-containing protein [Pedobacter nutrimenti]|uniref:Uncharacterized protein DUF3858 n=1 Tax=Pedobacter nutrimenti TaxID=1241337 RepID=A0A318UJV9_9SPHI|nr:DUF3858 domain-containing protein [Pedobacter nutrimenti]PYF76624.1 uncharacterized protein DUF3858 [Pedobacter nutrimenti]